MSKLVRKLFRSWIIHSYVNNSTCRQVSCSSNLIFFNNRPTNLTTSDSNLIFYRNKYTKKYSNTEQSAQRNESDVDSDSEEWLKEPIGNDGKVVSVGVNSLRNDVIIKSGLNMARNKVEKAFYESRIRVNERKIFKKSEQLRIGDEVDVIRNVSPTNPKFLVVSRVIVLTAVEQGEHIKVTLKRFKSLLIENYKDPWKPTADNS